MWPFLFQNNMSFSCINKHSVNNMEENDSFSLHFPSPILGFLTYSGGILPIRRTFRDRPKVAKVPSPQPKKVR